MRQFCVPVQLEELERGAFCYGRLVNVSLDDFPGFGQVGQEDAGVAESLGQRDANDSAASSQFENGGRGWSGGKQDTG